MRVSHFAVLILLFFLTSVCCSAQRVDAALVGGVSLVSDTTVRFAVPCVLPPSSCPPTAFSDHLQTSHSYFLTGSVAVRLLDRKTYALHLEFPAAGVYSQILKLPSTPTFVSEMSSIFVTPSVRVKLMPEAFLSPWASAGGGWAQYKPDPGVTTDKAAIQFGGGLDIKTRVQRLRIRAEVRDFLTGAPEAALVSGPFVGKPQGGFHRHNVFVGGGVLIRF